MGTLVGGGIDLYALAPIPMIEVLPVELRLRPEGLDGSLDLLLDWEQLVITGLLTSQPRLGLTALAHGRVPLGAQWDLALAPGLDVEWGRDAVIIDERLRWVPSGSFGLSGRVGLDRRGLRRTDLGLYARGVAGFRAGLDGPEAWRQLMLEVAVVRRLGDVEEAASQ